MKCIACDQESNNLSMLCPMTGGFHSLPEPKTYTEAEHQKALMQQDQQNTKVLEAAIEALITKHQKAMQEQRKAIWKKIVESKQHMKVNHIDYVLIRGIIFGDSDE